jgi:hypothetical protein
MIPPTDQLDPAYVETNDCLIPLESGTCVVFSNQNLIHKMSKVVNEGYSISFLYLEENLIYIF